MNLKVVSLTAIVAAAGAVPAIAHHSFAMFDAEKTVTLEGTVKEFLWRNPHSFIKIEATDEKGEVHLWTTEWASPTQLSESKLTKTSLRPGDKVVVIGAPGRDPEAYRIRVTSVTRPVDGWKWEGTIQ